MMENVHKVIVSHDKPEIYDRLRDKFGADWDDGVIIAYHGKIHCKYDVEPQKTVHEMVHLDRQKKIGDEAWWRLYIDNDIFRLEEEAMAYKAEADFIKRHIKNREDRFHIIRDIAKSFSSSLYGNIIGLDEAMRIIG